MLILTILSALAGAVMGFAGAGLGAAEILASALGDHDGGSSMSGFFVFGPIGGVAGALLGAGLMMRFGGVSRRVGKVFLISAVAVSVLGGLLLVVASSPDRGPVYANVIEFELEFPAATFEGVEIPSANAMWGAAGGDSDDKPTSQFFEKACASNVCVVHGSIAALGAMNHFRVTALIGQKKFRFPLDLPAVVVPADWSGWQQGDGARVRWRVVKR